MSVWGRVVGVPASVLLLQGFPALTRAPALAPAPARAIPPRTRILRRLRLRWCLLSRRQNRRREGCFRCILIRAARLLLREPEKSHRVLYTYAYYRQDKGSFWRVFGRLGFEPFGFWIEDDFWKTLLSRRGLLFCAVYSMK